MSWHIPLIGRLSGREYSAVALGTLFLALETLLHIVILFLPQSVINWFYERTRTLFHQFSSPPRPKSPEKVISDRVRKARDFTALCEIFGYVPEEHVILTKDGYLLTLHRLPTKKNQRKTAPGTSTGKPCVYLHHGLLMNSEVWICLTDEQRCLPFVLAEQGFDVWLGMSLIIAHLMKGHTQLRLTINR
jgi:lysosomal acid lipase/cholesteryl ester hydrolase